MIKFGPSGNSESFFSEGYKHTKEMPEWLSKRGLDIFEYSFGRGILISAETATEVGNIAKANNIEITAHAPYFINFAALEQEKIENSYNYILNSVKIEKCFGGNRVVFHSGAQMKQDRSVAFDKVKAGVEKTIQRLLDEGYDDVFICPETMGKQGQIGTVQEVIDLCKIHKNIIPCVDFGHVNSLLQGALKTTDDYKRIVLDPIIDQLGYEKARIMHVHFSKIQYGAKGEIKHLTFEDTEYGPEFEPLAVALKEYKLEPYILSESAGTQAEDASEMKRVFNSL